MNQNIKKIPIHPLCTKNPLQFLHISNYLYVHIPAVHADSIHNELENIFRNNQKPYA